MSCRHLLVRDADEYEGRAGRLGGAVSSAAQLRSAPAPFSFLPHAKVGGKDVAPTISAKSRDITRPPSDEIESARGRRSARRGRAERRRGASSLANRTRSARRSRPPLRPSLR